MAALGLIDLRGKHWETAQGGSDIFQDSNPESQVRGYLAEWQSPSMQVGSSNRFVVGKFDLHF